MTLSLLFLFLVFVFGLGLGRVNGLHRPWPAVVTLGKRAVLSSTSCSDPVPTTSTLSVRQLRLVVASALACMAVGSPAFAKDSEGTKQDKKFELCVSKCIFLATKPPPAGSDMVRLEETSSRTRVDIIRACRIECATTKEQLLLGKPKVGKAPPAAAASSVQE